MIELKLQKDEKESFFYFTADLLINTFLHFFPQTYNKHDVRLTIE